MEAIKNPQAADGEDSFISAAAMASRDNGRSYAKCPRCKEQADRTKYTKTAECFPDGEGNGMIHIQVGACYIGKRYRVLIQEATH